MIWIPVVGRWADIDVYASMMAYVDLLNQRGKSVKAYVKPETINYSVPEVLRVKELENDKFDLRPGDEAIILDISIPEIINQFVPDEQILELIDHHPGYEEYWQKRLGSKAIIEKIGAVATSIFEWWGECWDYAKMSPKIAKLLIAAILDNTLDFNAEITTERDRKAAEKLAEIAGVKLDEYRELYFRTVEEEIAKDLKSALLNDTKPGAEDEFAFAQLTTWNAKRILEDGGERIREVLDSEFGEWVLNLIDISGKRSVILANSERLKEYFTKLLDLRNVDGALVADRLYLRKEILKKMLEKR